MAALIGTTAAELMPADAVLMARAIALAGRGRSTVSPNPMVGAVLTNGGTVVGEGYHERPGSPHAEALALAAAGPATRGATCYVNLEPCAHFGRTPPCADALIAAGVSRVVVAMIDPDPRVAGAGIARLRDAGVLTEVGAGATAAEALNAAYLVHRRLGRPRITCKAGMSLDGKVAAADGSSQWITGEAARSDGHRLRAEAGAVAVGAGTALADDPRLTVRLAPAPERPPVRVLFDAVGRVPATLRLFDAEAPALVCATGRSAPRQPEWRAAGAEVVVLEEGLGGVDLEAAVRMLAERGILELLVEGGPTLQASFWSAGLVDRLVWYVAPLVLGGAAAPGVVGGGGAPTLAAARRVQIDSVDRLGDDLRIVATPLAAPVEPAAEPAEPADAAAAASYATAPYATAPYAMKGLR